jgi:type IV fimbrial biogenesis protein FimT
VLVALAIVAVLAALALPGMRHLVRDYQVRVVAQDLLADLNWARAEAARRGLNVTLSIHKPSRCLPSPTTGQQRCGWVIFLDRNGDGLQAASDRTLRRYELPSRVDLPNPSQEDIVFHPQDGSLKKSLHLEVAQTGASASDPASRVLCMGFGARIRITAGVACDE